MKLNFPTKKIPDCFTIDEKLQANDREQLVVVLHGILNAWEFVDPLVKAIDDIYERNVDIWIPILPYSKFLTFQNPEKIIEQLNADLVGIWKTGKYTSLRVIGHSMGGVYARALILQGLKSESIWSECKPENIRLVLLAAVNRGAGISRHMKPLTVLKTAFGTFLGRLIQTISAGYLEPTLFSGMRGSQFITRMRLEWLKPELNRSLPCTVQLLGSIDDVVGPEDNIDLATGENFRYLEVPYTGHVNILQMTENEKTKENEKQRIQERKKILEIALKDKPENIEKNEVRPWELKKIDEDERNRRNQIKHVVFIIHGIRDEGHWTDKIARRVWSKVKTAEQNSLEKIVDSYGYFGMGPFLIPGIRWKKVSWLMEKYLEVRAKYPEAKFSYIGHSHGTYVLAKALENYKECKFHNVVFAGSIVRENYNWKKLIENEQVYSVLNFVSTWDWVVAWFPNFLGLYNLQDLGGASHNGFSQATKDGPVYNIRYAEVAHGAGKREGLWDIIAEFILMEKNDPLPEILSKFIQDEIVKDEKKQNIPLTKIQSKFIYLLRELFGLSNIIIWTLIISVFFVIVPILIVSCWSYIAQLISLLTSLATSSLGLKILLFIAIIFYLANAFRQKEYQRNAWQIRSFLLFPVTFCLSFIGARNLIIWLLSTAYFQNIQFPPVEMWSPAALILWLFFVVWVLSKI
ncbi:MAG: alpha/beta hydrolase [Xenococcus sp. MO_188.B8]|nr:alpha/beta hydrolase [Xenococcus sp. MO_188.B8]